MVTEEKKQTNNNLVKIIKNTRGRRMTDEQFAKLSRKDQIRVERNRRSARATKEKRKKRLAFLKRENALLEASIKLKEIQCAVLTSLLNPN